VPIREVDVVVTVRPVRLRPRPEVLEVAVLRLAVARRRRADVLVADGRVGLVQEGAPARVVVRLEVRERAARILVVTKREDRVEPAEARLDQVRGRLLMALRRRRGEGRAGDVA